MSQELERIKDIINENLRNTSNILHRKENNDLLKWIYDNTPHKLLNGNFNLSTIVYWLINSLDDFPTCQMCGEQLYTNKNVNITRGYPKYCCNCSHNTEYSKRKREQTCLKKYGCKNPFGNDSIKTKIKNTNIKKYGVPYVMQNKLIQKKSEETCMKKYGVDRYSKTEEYNKKKRETCLLRYGNEYVSRLPSVKEKTRDTCISKYGVDCTSRIPGRHEKTVKTLIRKYGKNYKNKLFIGHGNIGQSKRAYGYILKSKLVDPLFTEEDYIQGKLKDINYMFKFRCKICGTEFMSIWDNGKCYVCPKCSNPNGTSELEKELYDFLCKETGRKLPHNNRDLIKPYELDIVDYESKICVEFDGLYWHSDLNNKDNNYHIQKTKKCNSIGYKLIHVFEDEWKFKNNVVKNKLIEIFNSCHLNSVEYDRIGILNNETAIVFLNENDLFDIKEFDISIGMYSGNTLISIMTFKDRMFGNWDLTGFCNKIGEYSVGTFKKLLDYFTYNYKPVKITTEQDTRWLNTDIFETFGFKKVLETQPRPCYINFNSGRIEKIDNCDILQYHNDQVMFRKLGYAKIYDCGTTVFEWVSNVV